MDISKIKLFDLMQSNLNYLSSRQTVLSQNIANANTPGYESSDIQRPDFSKALESVTIASLATTNPNHISGTKTATDTFRKVSTAGSGYEIKPSGNKVSLEDEVMKMSQTGIEYQQTTSIYRKMVEMLKTAIGNV